MWDEEGGMRGLGSIHRRLAVSCAVGAILVAVMGLLGYAPGMELLGSLRRGLIPMAPSTAISFILLGAVVLALVLRPPSGRNLLAFAGVSALVSLFGLLEVPGHFTGLDLNFEDAIVPNAGYLGEIPIARMSPATGAEFLLAGLGIIALVAGRRPEAGPRSGHIAGGLGSLVVGIGLVFCFSYFVATPLLYGQAATIPMALTTAIAFLLLGSAMVGAAGGDAFPTTAFVALKRNERPISTRQRLGYLAMVMVTACAMVMWIMTFILYRHEIQQQREMLLVTAQSQARLIESVAHHNAEVLGSNGDGSPNAEAYNATLSEVASAHGRYEGFGETGEFTLAVRDGDDIVFVMRHRLAHVDRPAPVAFQSVLAEPMRRALSGRSGTMIGLDYRGETVLAAYEPVAVLNLGIVAKVDMAEVRVPYIRSGLSAASIAILVIIGGMTLFLWIGNPIVERLKAQAGELKAQAGELKAEVEQRRQSESKLLAFMDSATEGFLVYDSDLKLTSINQHALKIFPAGSTEEDLKGKHMLEVAPILKESGRYEKYLEVLETGEPIHFENTVADPKFGERFLSIKAFRAGTSLAMIFTDVTEELLSAAALKESEEQLRRAVMNAPFPIMIHAEGGEVLRINNVWMELTGYSLDEMPTIQDWASRVLGEDTNGVHPALDAIFERNGIESDGVFAVRTKTGETMYWDFSSNPLGRLPDKRGLVISMAADVTERKRAEEEKSKLEEQLYQSQKLESVGQLAGGIAHDFNNLLTVINSYAEIANESLHQGDPLKTDIQQILGAGQRAALLTRQLLAFSRKQVMENEVIDLNEVVGNLERMLRRVIGEDVEFRTHLARRLCRVYTDAGQIEQVLMNLAINARDAMPNGGKLTIETAEVELDEEYVSRHPDASVGRHAMLVVTDTGIGMTAETKERIFEPFFTTKEKGRGTGLGLAMVYGIIKQSGGSIVVHSEPDHGTVFKVHLPATEIQTSESRREPQSRTRQGNETILVVEDEEAVRVLTGRILRSGGYQVVSAADGDRALFEFERLGLEIDLVLTDVVMPRMSGKHLADRLLEITPDLKVLFTSGYTDDTIVDHGVLEEGIHFIAKPFNSSLLLRKVRRVLDGV